MNRISIHEIERRLIKIEKERAATAGGDMYNQTLNDLGYAPCATPGEAFVQILKLMSAGELRKKPDKPDTDEEDSRLFPRSAPSPQSCKKSRPGVG